MANEFNNWKEAMKIWLKQLIKWQEAHPDKNWLQELGTADTDDEGSNPPPPPPPPPHG
jgi:hypothetical protein